MKRPAKRPTKDFNAIHLIMGLLLGFFLGSTAVYWHFNRQNDRLFSETLDKVLSLFSAQGIQIDHNDSAGLFNQADSLEEYKTSQPLSTPASSQSNTYLIAQDRLIHTTTISIPGFKTSTSSSGQQLDSLLGKKARNSQRDQVFFIEFWESPLHSLGYKMGKNKIALYGIRSFDMVSLSHQKGKLFLQYMGEYYPLEHTTSFRPLVPASGAFTFEEMRKY